MLGSSKMFRKVLLGTAAVALMGAAGSMTVSKDANAVAYAYSELQVSNMVVQINGVTTSIDTIGVGTANGSGFDSFQFQLNELNVKLGGSQLQSAAPAASSSTTSGASLDQAQLCLGDCGTFVNNVYTPAPAPGALGNFAVSDTHMTNTVLDGSAFFGQQAGAQSHGGGTLASGSQLSGSTMNWNFNTSADDAGKVFSLQWDELRHLQVQTTNLGESATATLLFTITLEKIGGDLTEIFALSPSSTSIGVFDDPINKTVFDSTSTDVGLVSSGVVLDGNSSYKLLFTFNSSAIAVSPIPEPAALGLLGAGLIGLGALQRVYRRKKVAA